jgi:hypothetical protein
MERGFMNNELITLQDAVRNQIKETVMRAIPSESIDKLVKDYFNGEFKSFVQSELKKAIEMKFREDVSQQAQLSYDQYGRNIMKNVCSEVGQSIMQGFQNAIISQVMYNVQQGMNQVRY